MEEKSWECGGGSEEGMDEEEGKGEGQMALILHLGLFVLLTLLLHS